MDRTFLRVFARRGSTLILPLSCFHFHAGTSLLPLPQFRTCASTSTSPRLCFHFHTSLLCFHSHTSTSTLSLANLAPVPPIPDFYMYVDTSRLPHSFFHVHSSTPVSTFALLTHALPPPHLHTDGSTKCVVEAWKLRPGRLATLKTNDLGSGLGQAYKTRLFNLSCVAQLQAGLGARGLYRGYIPNTPRANYSPTFTLQIGHMLAHMDCVYSFSPWASSLERASDFHRSC